MLGPLAALSAFVVNERDFGTKDADAKRAAAAIDALAAG